MADVARRCLNDAIDNAGITRRALAEDFVRVGEAQFSKLVHSAAIDVLDKLPDEVVIDFVTRLGKARGLFDVTPADPQVLDGEVVRLLEQAHGLLKLRKVRGRPVKAALPMMSERRALP